MQRPELPDEPSPAPEESADAAGLRYVTDATPGIRRKRAGTGFTYVDADGRKVRGEETLARIRALAIPPAWTDVWIAATPIAHLQATGRDEKGRKQYRYHPCWRRVRDATKYHRMVAFAQALPRIRARVARDLARQGLPCEKVLAVVVRLLDRTHARVGNEAYARENQHYGLTTLRADHVDVSRDRLRFEYVGKSGKTCDVDVKDPRVARIVRRMQELPGQELFQCVGNDGERHRVNSASVNAYLREVTGDDFTAKDFRTWAGTVMAARALAKREPPENKTQAKRDAAAAIKEVAAALGNTPAVCRKSYVHPVVLDAYADGALPSELGNARGRAGAKNGLSAHEQAVAGLLAKHERALLARGTQ